MLRRTPGSFTDIAGPSADPHESAYGPLKDLFFVRMGEVVQAGEVYQVAAGATTSLRTVASGTRTNSFVP